MTYDFLLVFHINYSCLASPLRYRETKLEWWQHYQVVKKASQYVQSFRHSPRVYTTNRVNSDSIHHTCIQCCSAKDGKMTKNKPDKTARLFHCPLTEQIQLLNTCASAAKILHNLH